MAPPPSRVRVHRGQMPRSEGPILPNPDTRAGEATNTSHHRRILFRSRTLDPFPIPNRGHSYTAVYHNSQA